MFFMSPFGAKASVTAVQATKSGGAVFQLMLLPGACWCLQISIKTAPSAFADGFLLEGLEVITSSLSYHPHPHKSPHYTCPEQPKHSLSFHQIINQII